jgi:hypothetical protein
MMAKEKLYHVTVLSNFARGFDKYSHGYSKARTPESTHSGRFFLLYRGELAIGVQKAGRLLEKLGLSGNRLIVLETELDASLLHPNAENGRGHFICSDQIALSQLFELEHDGDVIQLRPTAVEDAMAASLGLLNRELLPFLEVRPRAIYRFCPSHSPARPGARSASRRLRYRAIRPRPDWIGKMCLPGLVARTPTGRNAPSSRVVANRRFFRRPCFNGWSRPVLAASTRWC